MPEHIWSVLCHKGCLDHYTNSVSLLDVVEAIRLRPIGQRPEGPNVVVGFPMRLSLVSLWVRSHPDVPERLSMRVVVVKPDGTEVLPQVALEGDLTEKRRLRTFAWVEALPFSGPGVYQFAIEYRSGEQKDWRRVAMVPVEVEVEVPPQAAPSPPVSAKRQSRRKRLARN